jgi:hypothetical protein
MRKSDELEKGISLFSFSRSGFARLLIDLFGLVLHLPCLFSLFHGGHHEIPMAQRNDNFAQIHYKIIRTCLFSVILRPCFHPRNRRER